MNSSKRALMAAGGALLATGASLFASGQTVVPVNSGLNMGSANVCPSGQTTPAPCSQTATVTFKFTAGGTIGVPAVVTQGAANLDFTDAGGGTCKANTAYSAANTCTVNVTFKPKRPGPRYGAAELLDASGNLLATGYVQGTGVGPLVTFANSTSGDYAPGKQTTLHIGFSGHIAVDASGDVFVTDEGNGLVKELMAVNGSIPPSPTIRTLGSGFKDPCGIAVDGAGNVFVGDRGLSGVREIVAASGYTTVKTVGSGFNLPNGVAVDGSGNVFVSDWQNNAVYEVLAAGGYTTVNRLPSAPGNADFLALDGNGNVFLANFTPQVYEILAAGGYTTVKTLSASIPAGALCTIAIDGSGNVFVADWYSASHAVYEVFAAGGYTSAVTLTGAFNRPGSVAVDGSGNVLVRDSSNLVKLDYADPPSLTFATTAADSTSTDSPQSVTIANNGNQNLDISGIGYATDFPEASGVSTDCTTSTPLATGESCTLSIAFSPLAASATGLSTPLSETITLTDNNLNDSAVEQSVAVKGTETITIVPPALTSPRALSGSNATFRWSPAGVPTDYLLKLGTTHFGASDVFGGVTSATSMPVSGIPTNGATLYATLSYKVSGTWTPINYTFTEAGSPTPPAMITPAGGSTLTGPSATFSWSPGLGPTSYVLKLGTTHFGATDVFNGATTSTSIPVSGIPTAGGTLYAQLEYKVAGTWIPINYSYTQAPGPTIPPAMLTPASGSTLTGSSATFNWSRGAGSTEYSFKLGTTHYGASDLYAATTTSTSLSVPVIPTNGVTLYATLGYKVGATWTAINYTYTEAGSWIHPSMVTPAPGSTLTSSSVTFNWTPGGGPTEYRLRIGSTGPGSSDLYLGNGTTTLSAPVAGLPTNGQPVYVSLGYKVNEVWHAESYTYTAQ